MEYQNLHWYYPAGVPMTENVGSQQQTGRTPNALAEFGSLQHSINQVEQAYQSHCPAPQSGIYYLFNIGTGKYLDVQGRRTADGTAIFAFSLNSPPTSNQQWKFVRQSPNGYICTLQSGHANGSIYALSATPGTNLVQSQSPTVWQLIPFGKNRFKLKLAAAETCLVLTFPNDTKNRSPAQLQLEDSSNYNQLWIFQS